MDHHLVLILAEVLGQIALTGVAIKGRYHELLENSYSNTSSENGELDASVVMDESVVM